jgi:putative DNA primase/helicase
VSKEYVSRIAAGIIKQLREGTAPWIRPWRSGERYLPHNPISGHHYRGINVVWLMVQSQERGYLDTRWMTYRQAQSTGAQVSRGEKGTTIQYWKWDGTSPVLDDSGAPRRDEQGKPQTERVQYTRPRVFTATVFNAEQIDGLAPATVGQQPPEWERHEKAELILKASGVPINHVPQERAYYSVQNDHIVLPLRSQFPTADSYYAIGLHEVAHSTGHPSRLNRDIGHPFGSELYAREELRAEIASLMMGDELGIGHDPGQHVAYVGSWIKVLQNDPLEVFRAAAAAERIQTYVLGLAQQQAAEQEQLRSHSVARDDRMDPNMVAVALNHELGHVAPERVNLQVPYREKELANHAGADLDPVAKIWYAPPGADLDALTRWRVEPSRGVSDAIPADPRQEFADALRGGGLVLDGDPNMDGTMHRVRVEGDRGGQRSGAYVGHLDGHPVGFIQNYKTGLKTNWKSAMTVHSLRDLDRQRLQQEAAERQAERLKRRKEEQEAVATRARWQLSTAPVAPDDHPYLHIKGFSDNQHALRHDRYGNLLVPAHDIDKTVWSFQRITATGDKMFLKGGRLDGCHALLSSRELKHSDPNGLYVEQTVLIVAEGYATGRTLERATGLPVAVAFSSSNLVHVAQAYRDRFPDLHIIVAGDNDHRKPLERVPDGHPKKNVGKDAAEAAAAAVGGYALLPPFASEEHGTDWNDFEQLRGREEAHAAIKDGVTVAVVNIDGQRIAAGLQRFPVHYRGADLEHPANRQLGHVVAPTLQEAREKLRRGEWVATESRAMISASLVDVFESNMARADRERADAQRTIERDRLRLADARGTGHDGESVAETLRSDEATAQRAETPVQTHAALDMMRETAEGEAQRQSIPERRDRRRSRTR